MGKNIGKLTAHVGADIKPLQAAQLKANRVLGNFGKGIAGVTKALGPFAAAVGVAGVAVGGLLVLRKVIDIGAKFEKTMVTTGAVMRATSTEMEGLTSIAKEMGEKTEFSATQAGEALQFLGMAGFNAAQAIEALPGVLDLATASGLDLGRAADIASNALTAMGLEVEDLERVNDTLIGTTNRANVNMEQMAEAFKFAAPVGAAFGYEIEELNGMLGKLGQAGLQGSIGGRGLAFAMIRARKVAKQLNLESSDLVDVLVAMKDAGMDADDVLEKFGMIGGKTALLIQKQAGAVRELQNELYTVGGEAAAQAEKMRNTVKGSFDELKSVIQSVAIDAFAQFSDSLKEMVKGITAFIRANKEAIVGTIVGMASALTKLLGHARNVSKGINKAFATTFSALETDGEQAFGGVQNFGQNFLTVMEFIFNTLVNIVSGAIGIVVGSIMNMSEAMADTSRAAVAFFGRDFKGAAELAKSAISNFKDSFKTSGQAVAGSMINIGDAWNDMMDTFEGRNRKKPAEIVEELFGPFLDEEMPDFDFGKGVGGGGGEDGDGGGTTSSADMFGPSLKGSTAAFTKLTNTRTKLLKGMLGETGRTSADMLKLWDEYSKQRVTQIQLEGEALAASGVSAELVTEQAALRMRELSAEQVEIFKENAAKMEGIGVSLGATLKEGFQPFIEAIKGDWDGLLDYMEKTFLRLAEKLGSRNAGGGDVFDKIGGFLGGGGGGGGAGGGGVLAGDAPFHPMAAGGIVMSPTLGLVGERGPEAVIPLSKFNDPKFLDAIGGGQKVEINMNIQAQDAQSFQDSRGQIMSAFSVAAEQARRRDT